MAVSVSNAASWLSALWWEVFAHIGMTSPHGFSCNSTLGKSKLDRVLGI